MILALLTAMALAQAQTPVPVPSVSTALGGAPPPATPVAILDWSTGSGSATWAGLGTPQIDCVASASGGTYACTGATPTNHGTPAPTTIGSPWYPLGWAGAEQMAVQYDNTQNYTDFGVVNIGTSFTLCFETYLVLNPPANTGSIIGIDQNVGSGSGRQWELSCDSSLISGYLFKDNSNYTAFTIGTIGTSSFHVACMSYDASAGDNNGVILGNLDGVASTPLTNARAPMQQSTAPLAVGHYYGGRWWGGSMSRFAFWPTAASTAQLATAVATMQNLYLTKPSTTPIAFARTSAETCQPVTGVSNWMTVAANTPCVTDKGVWAGPSGAGKISYSTPSAGGWVAPGTANASGCYGINGLKNMDSLTTADGNNPTYITTTTFAGAMVSSALFAAASGSHVGSIAWQGGMSSPCTGVTCARSDGGSCSVSFNATGSRCIASGTFTSSTAVRMWMMYASATTSTNTLIIVGGNLTTGDTICVSGVQHENTLTPGPIYPATGVNPSWPATTISVASASWSSGVDANTWQLTEKASATDWTPPASGIRGIFGWGPYSANGSYVDLNNSVRLLVDTYDSTGAEHYAQPNISIPASGEHTFRLSHVGGVFSLFIDGVSSITPFTSSQSALPSTLYVGQLNNGSQASAFVKKLCVGKSLKSVAGCL